MDWVARAPPGRRPEGLTLMPTLEERVETRERRVSEWEGQVGFLVPLVRQLHREILTTREDVQHLNTKVDRLDSKVTQLDTKVTQLDTKVNQGLLR
jgi:peptidoglycan hydrolase CwlO-like protein